MMFPRDYPSYRRDHIDWLRTTQFHQLDAQGHVYLDYTGGGLAPQQVVMDHLWLLRDAVAGNPHSDSPAALRSTQWTDEARGAVLNFFRADPDQYTVIWTANATQAIRLVGEAYPFDDFLYTQDAHNSLIGIREYARRRKAQIRYLPLDNQLRVGTDELVSRLALVAGEHRLLGFPAQCNFSGVQHPLGWITLAQDRGWRVLLDAAAFVPTNALDLTRYPADYVAISCYKMTGWPTGVGALIARQDALEDLVPPAPAGGSTRAASVAADWSHVMTGAAGHEHGTLNYLALPGVTRGLEFLTEVGMASIHDRVTALGAWTLEALAACRHPTGAPQIQLYGPQQMRQRGATIAFNLLDPAGQIIDERIVAHRAAAAGISLRTGCFCAPGAGEVAFGLELAALAAAGDVTDPQTADDYLQVLGMASGGAIRISYGLASNAGDAERFIEWITSFSGQSPTAADLPARMHC